MKVASKTASSTSSIISPRVLELRSKIQNKDYVDFAVQRIAQVLSRRIVEDHGHRSQRGLYESK